MYGKLLLNVFTQAQSSHLNKSLIYYRPNIKLEDILKIYNKNEYSKLNSIPNKFNYKDSEHWLRVGKDHNLIFNRDFITPNNMMTDNTFELYFVHLDIASSKFYFNNMNQEIESCYIKNCNSGIYKILIEDFILDNEYKFAKSNIIYIKNDDKIEMIFNINVVNKFIYITTSNDMSLTNSINNITIDHICSLDAVFDINSYFINETEYCIRIKRLDRDFGWNKNLYLNINIDDEQDIFLINRTLYPEKYIIIKTNFLLKPR